MISSSHAPIGRCSTLSVKAPMRKLYNTTSECEVMHDMDKDSTYLSKTHCAKEILRTYNLRNTTPRLTLMQPSTRFNKGDCDKNPSPDFSSTLP